MRAPPIVGVPLLTRCDAGPSVAHDLSDLLASKLSNEPGRHEEGQQHRGDGRCDDAEWHVPEDVEPAEPDGVVTQREEELVEHQARASP